MPKDIQVAEVIEVTNQQVNTNSSDVQVIPQNEKLSISTLISEAMEKPNFNVEILERLMKLSDSFEDRVAQKAFNEDFAKMMAKIPVVEKTGVNKHTGSKFAQYSDIVEITRPILAEFGFSVTYKQDQEMIPNVKFEAKNVFCMMKMTCVLKHRLGHQEETSTLLPIAMVQSQTPIQAMGMGSTYGKRYTLMQALNIATMDDNDGSSYAVKPETTSKKPLKDERLKLAIAEAQKGGDFDFCRQVLDKHELTDIQKDLINGLIASQNQENTEGNQ